MGVNRFKDEASEQGGPSIPFQKIDARLEEEQRARLAAFKGRRDHRPVGIALAAVEGAARSGSNLLPHIVRAVEACATLGEISDTLRGIFGAYRPAAVV